jgi:formylglycine-generating enzyme
VSTANDFYPSGNPDEAPEFSSTVSTFALDKYEVTVGRFRKFVNAYVSNTATVPASGAGANPSLAGSGWQSVWNTSLPATQAALTTKVKCDATYQTWTDAAGANENKAINCVSWYEAFAFCIWDGGRLATESEWEYAAAGGGGADGDRRYPWGQTPPNCTYANFFGAGPCSSGGSGSVTAVGSTPIGNGKWGHSDLAGNVWEWALDWYGTYPTVASTNYANISSGPYRVVRGGSFLFDGFDGVGLRAAYRYNGSPDKLIEGIGLRCSRTAQ